MALLDAIHVLIVLHVDSRLRFLVTKWRRAVKVGSSVVGGNLLTQNGKSSPVLHADLPVVLNSTTKITRWVSPLFFFLISGAPSFIPQTVANGYSPPKRSRLTHPATASSYDSIPPRSSALDADAPYASDKLRAPHSGFSTRLSTHSTPPTRDLRNSPRPAARQDYSPRVKRCASYREHWKETTDRAVQDTQLRA